MGSYQFEGRSQFRFKSKEVCTILILKIFFVCVFYLFGFCFVLFFWSARKTYVLLGFCCEYMLRNNIEHYSFFNAISKRLNFRNLKNARYFKNHLQYAELGVTTTITCA